MDIDFSKYEVELIPIGGQSSGEKAIERTEEIRQWINNDLRYVKSLEERIAALEARATNDHSAGRPLQAALPT